ncbi:MAG: hypothetical protein KDC73_09300 [Ignavibacteriae bacterium]|nr:hypothetical protein [Ignavibacteriota bacterium]MCB9242094.1 hypothetical protein [Ignavibacteriales bacterium]
MDNFNSLSDILQEFSNKLTDIAPELEPNVQKVYFFLKATYMDFCFERNELYDTEGSSKISQKFALNNFARMCEEVTRYAKEKDLDSLGVCLANFDVKFDNLYLRLTEASIALKKLIEEYEKMEDE